MACGCSTMRTTPTRRRSPRRCTRCVRWRRPGGGWAVLGAMAEIGATSAGRAPPHRCADRRAGHRRPDHRGPGGVADRRGCRRWRARRTTTAVGGRRRRGGRCRARPSRPPGPRRRRARQGQPLGGLERVVDRARRAPGGDRAGGGGRRVIAILVAASVALVLSLLGTPLVIRFFRARGYGQLIREDGPRSHFVKRGTPTMGGAAIILAAVIAYLVATLLLGPALSPGGLLVMACWSAWALVGFVDDFLKLRRNRSLGTEQDREVRRAGIDLGHLRVRRGVRGRHLDRAVVHRRGRVRPGARSSSWRSSCSSPASRTRST